MSKVIRTTQVGPCPDLVLSDHLLLLSLLLDNVGQLQPGVAHDGAGLHRRGVFQVVFVSAQPLPVRAALVLPPVLPVAEEGDDEHHYEEGEEYPHDDTAM